MTSEQFTQWVMDFQPGKEIKHQMNELVKEERILNANIEFEKIVAYPAPTDDKQIAEQFRTNFNWLLEQMDKIHDALCPEQNGAWQQRAEQAVEAAKLINFNKH